MKFREMSWEELKADFRKKLDKYTTKELVKSLEKYKIKTEINKTNIITKLKLLFFISKSPKRP